MALRELVQGSLSGWVRLITLCRPQKIRREGGTLGGESVAELDNVSDGQEADQVHQQLETKSCKHTWF